MTATTWRPLSSPPVDKIREARLQLHVAAQLVASVADSLLPQADDDSQSALFHDAEAGLLRSAPIETPQLSGLTAALDISRLTLALAAGDRHLLAELPLASVTLAQGFDWLNEQLPELAGVTATVERRTFPDFPDHPLERGASFSEPDSKALSMLDHAYGNTDLLLQTLIAELDLPASAIRVWPHHFDMAVLLTVSSQGAGKFINAGFSPGDDTFEQPYWYVSPWPTPTSKGTLPALVVGQWLQLPWFGATAQLQEVVSTTAPAAAVGQFLTTGVGHSLGLLTR